MESKEKNWLLTIIIVNFVINFASVVIIAGTISSLVDEKSRLDKREPSDSNYISETIFVFACLITAFGFLVILLEFSANLSLFFGVRQDEFSRTSYKFYIWTSIIVTILIGCLGWTLLLYNHENVLDYMFHTSENNRSSSLPILIPWAIRIIYAVFATIVVCKCYRNETESQPILQKEH